MICPKCGKKFTGIAFKQNVTEFGACYLTDIDQDYMDNDTRDSEGGDEWYYTECCDNEVDYNEALKLLKNLMIWEKTGEDAYRKKNKISLDMNTIKKFGGKK